MEDSPTRAVEQEANTPKAAKDKNCPFCGQAFTSSSLGRHLDLYIKEKNPKPSDGVHDVDAIRKLRGGITRRQARGSLRRDTSTPARTPTASRRSPASEDAESSIVKSPLAIVQPDPIGRQFPFNTPWEATGVINDLSARSEADRSAEGDGASDSVRSIAPTQRAVSRQMMKSQLDMKQKMQDAADTARAAELALREMISSWRAAKQHIDMTSTPFDFEPLSLDFPALCLQCLEPPPTLFSSTQHATATSWSITPPGDKQYEALQRYFADEFQKWKITCAAATTVVNEDLTYPPSATIYKQDLIKDAVRRAEKTAENLEKEIAEHMESIFTGWQGLSEQQRRDFWLLELARGVGRKQKELGSMQNTQHSLKQENANLRTQIEHLNRLQQPREFKILPPATIPLDRKIIDFFLMEGVVHGKAGVGMNLNDRHSDLNTVVAAAIDRWKNVIVSTRASSGMGAQRSLNSQPSDAPDSGNANGSTNAGGGNLTKAQQAQTRTTRTRTQQSVPILQAPQPQRPATGNAANGTLLSATDKLSAEPRAPSTAPTADSTSVAASVSAGADDDDMSDQDADGDAEMDDDDGYASMNTPNAGTPLKMESQQQAPPAMPSQGSGTLEVPRTRGAAQSRTPNGTARSVTQAVPGGRNPANTGRSVTMQSMGGDPMYVD